MKGESLTDRRVLAADYDDVLTEWLQESDDGLARMAEAAGIPEERVASAAMGAYRPDSETVAKMEAEMERGLTYPMTSEN